MMTWNLKNWTEALFVKGKTRPSRSRFRTVCRRFPTSPSVRRRRGRDCLSRESFGFDVVGQTVNGASHAVGGFEMNADSIRTVAG
jgi:hypothetical protein